MHSTRISLLRLALLASLLLEAACGRAASDESHPHLGRPATAADVASADIDIAPDGTGLPPGSGTPRQGETVFKARCAACHGSGGIALVGGIGTLGSDHPQRTVGSYWPYATTIFDYTRRAMPPDRSQPISNEDDYAVTAYILAINGIIGPTDIMDHETLPRVQMPNVHGFVNSR